MCMHMLRCICECLNLVVFRCVCVGVCEHVHLDVCVGDVIYVWMDDVCVKLVFWEHEASQSHSLLATGTCFLCGIKWKSVITSPLCLSPLYSLKIS